MKQLKVLALAALVVLIAAPAFAADVEFSGQAAAKFGYSSDGSTTKDVDPTTSMGLAQDTGAELSASISEGKLSAGWAARVNAGGAIGAEAGWVSYDFGAAQVKYNAKGAEKRWNGDIHFFGDSANQTFDVKIIDMIFVSIFDTGSVGYENTGSAEVTTAAVAGVDANSDGDFDDAGDTAPVAAVYGQNSTFPAVSLGLDSSFGPAAVKAGMALEMFNDKDAAGDSVSSLDAYTAMLFFLDTSVTLGNIGIDFAFNYQMAESGLTGGQAGGGADGSAMGVRAGGKYSMSNMEFGYHGGWATANDGNEDYTKMELADLYFKYSLDDNFYVKPMVCYDTASSDAYGQDDADMEVAVVVGYSW